MQFRSPWPCRLFLFDLDGTLIDSRIDIANSVSLALARMSLQDVARSQVVELVGDGARKLIQRVLREAIGGEATPEQVRTEVWMALIHGAKGLVYFVHQFKPRFKEAALLDDPPMLAAVTALAIEHRIPVQVALEERMACGIGICMSCVAPIYNREGTGLMNVRTCLEGPVFNGARVAWARYGAVIDEWDAPTGN